MSKKKFTDGLESLFSISVEESEKDEVIVVVEGTEDERAKKEADKKKQPTTRRKPTKSFAADLESLFADVAATPSKVQTPTKKKTEKEEEDATRVFSGLESLLRNTVDTAKYNQTDPSKMKRVTFTFDKQKLARLKKIAKEQKAYLKDILGQVVTEYIDSYAQES